MIIVKYVLCLAMVCCDVLIVNGYSISDGGGQQLNAVTKQKVLVQNRLPPIFRKKLRAKRLHRKCFRHLPLVRRQDKEYYPPGHRFMGYHAGSTDDNDLGGSIGAVAPYLFPQQFFGPVYRYRYYRPPVGGAGAANQVPPFKPITVEPAQTGYYYNPQQQHQQQQRYKTLHGTDSAEMIQKMQDKVYYTDSMNYPMMRYVYPKRFPAIRRREMREPETTDDYYEDEANGTKDFVVGTTMGVEGNA